MRKQDKNFHHERLRRHKVHEVRLPSTKELKFFNFVAFVYFVVNLLMAGLGWAQTNSNAGAVTPLGFLGASARADALGAGFVGIADDSSALFFNSAGLAGLDRAQISLHHNSYLAGTFEETLLAGFPAGSWGGFAGALQYVDWGNLDGRDASGTTQGAFTDNDLELSFGWGLGLTPELSAGAALHGYQQKIAASSYTGLSGDAGLLWRPDKVLRLGLSYGGWGTALAGQSPSGVLKTGASGKWDWDKDKNLLLAFSGSFQPNGISLLQAGLEAGINQSYFLRLGYQLPLADNQVGGLTNLTAGAGVKFAGISLDYAYLPYGDLGASHRVSLAYDFPNPPPSKAVTVMATPIPAKSSLEVHFELPTGTTGTPDPTAEKKLEKYKEAVGKTPNDSGAWRDLGVVYFRSGHDAEALQCFEQALRLKPGDKELQLWIQKYKNNPVNGSNSP